MPHEQTTAEQPSSAESELRAPAVDERAAEAYARPEQDDGWLEQQPELAPRPRRRLLSPAPLALLGVLLTACGFIGGVLVEKGQTSSSASSSGGAASLIASRLAALRGGGASAASNAGSAGAAAGGGAGASGGAGALLGLGRGGAGRPLSGQVAYLSGSTLYVTDAEGNTRKVRSSSATSVTKTVKASVKAIHPGRNRDGRRRERRERLRQRGIDQRRLRRNRPRCAVRGRRTQRGRAVGAAGGGPALFGSGG